MPLQSACTSRFDPPGHDLQLRGWCDDLKVRTLRVRGCLESVQGDRWVQKSMKLSVVLFERPRDENTFETCAESCYLLGLNAEFLRLFHFSRGLLVWCFGSYTNADWKYL